MPPRVYIVEDHPVMREVLVEYLEAGAEFEVCGTAGTGQEALEGIPGARPSLILLDLSLPDGSGLDLLGEIRERWRIPCLILTGQGGMGDQDPESLVARAFATGARAYIRKGRPREIFEALRRVLEGGTYVSPSLGPEASSEESDTGT